MLTAMSIAGFDPSSGAGVTADLAVFAAHGLFGTSCITALTVQSTLGVKDTYPLAGDVVRDTLSYLTDDLPPAGIKIGMLATAHTVNAVADFLGGRPDQARRAHIVLDPVLRSSSGRELLDGAGLAAMQERLLPQVDWITPNLDELAILSGVAVATPTDMEHAGTLMQRRYPGLNLVVTGGHLNPPNDLVLPFQAEAIWLPGQRIESRSTHGTGCAFSSALMSRLVLGDSPALAARGAKDYVFEAIRRAVPMGGGAGPLRHLWPLLEGGEASMPPRDPGSRGT